MNMDFLLDIISGVLKQKAGENKIAEIVKSLNIKNSNNLKKIEKSNIIVSTVSMEIDTFKELADYIEYVNNFMEKAVSCGAQLVCFPELCGLLPISLIPFFDRIIGTISGKGKKNEYKKGSSINTILGKGVKNIFEAINEIHICLFKELARSYGVYVVSGSTLFWESDKIYNRGHLIDYNGKIAGFQDKAQLLQIEKDLGICSGENINVYETEVGKIAFPICMDATYYETFKIAKAKGAQIIVAPIANMEDYNYYLSIRGMESRIQESRIYGVKSALVGGEKIGLNFTGLAGIFAPAELTKNKDGIIAVSTDPKKSDVVTAVVNLSALDDLKDCYRDDDNLPFLQKEFENTYNSFFINNTKFV